MSILMGFMGFHATILQLTPLVQDEVLQDTTAGQALRDSWRTAVPNARFLERTNEGFSQEKPGGIFFQCCFCVGFLPPPLFFEFGFWIGSMIIFVKSRYVFFAETEVGMEALMIWSILLEISPRMERQSFQEI